MRLFARNMIAAALAVLLAALACFEHGLHDVSHVHSHHACCAPTKSLSCDAHDCCSQQHSARHDADANDQSAPVDHDPDNCAVCRFLALPQLSEPAQNVPLAEMLVAELVITSRPSFTSRTVTLLPIRGPPVS